MPLRVHSAVGVPPRPENYLLDQGDVFPSEVEQRIVDALKACARDYDVHLYVMTMPSLKVMPLRSAERLNQLHSATRTEWLKGQVGVLIIFDDEAGRVLAGESEEARKVFSPSELAMIFNDPKFQNKTKRSGGERLAGTVTLLIQRLTDLRVKSNEKARKRLVMNMVFGAVAGVVVLGGAGFFVMKRRAAKAAAPSRRRRSLHE